jgi:hypothetical protein
MDQFNPPPNWPTPPPGWYPPPGWRPDASWGPIPPGWRLFVRSITDGESGNEMDTLSVRLIRLRHRIASDKRTQKLGQKAREIAKDERTKAVLKTAGRLLAEAAVDEALRRSGREVPTELKRALTPRPANDDARVGPLSSTSTNEPHRPGPVKQEREEPATETASSDDDEPLQNATRLRPDVGSYPAPKTTLTDTLRSDTLDFINAGGYALNYSENYHDWRFSASSLRSEFPRHVGGVYDVTLQSLGGWTVLLDKTGGFPLPIAIRRAGAHAMQFRIDPQPLVGYPTLAPNPRY